MNVMKKKHNKKKKCAYKFCNNYFEPVRGLHIYCSSKCGVYAWQERNPERKKFWTKKYIDANRKKIVTEAKTYRQKNKDKIKKLVQDWHKRNPHYGRDKYRKDKKKYRKLAREYYYRNREVILERNKARANRTKKKRRKEVIKT